MKLLTIDMVSVAKEEPRIHIAVDVIKAKTITNAKAILVRTAVIDH